jgi:hypothetical protein
LYGVEIQIFCKAVSVADEDVEDDVSEASLSDDEEEEEEEEEEAVPVKAKVQFALLHISMCPSMRSCFRCQTPCSSAAHVFPGAPVAGRYIYH